MNILLIILGVVIALGCACFGIMMGSVVGILIVSVALFRIGFKAALRTTQSSKSRQYGIR